MTNIKFVIHDDGTGAGEGNRTLATSLEGWGSTTELHPHNKKSPYQTSIVRDIW